MDTREAIDVLDKTFYVGLLVVTPLLGSGLAIGLFVAILQSITQIQEMTLTFIPKMLVMTLVMMYSMSWMFQKVIDFAIEVFLLIPK
ncbi:MAG: flagellar biosynthetic protein FliQ [Planctomycetes bacterium]|nr:flagellar biosynthetic protein FliQ [Planctomycetota bacterium]